MATTTITATETVEQPKLQRLNANDPLTTCELVVDIIRRDGGVIIEGLIDRDMAEQIRTELKPVYEADVADTSGFFPTTTRRATGLLGTSDGCVQLAINKLWIDVCNKVLTSTCSPWYGQKRMTWTSKPILAGTFGFQIHPGSRAQDLHRDDSDYHLPSGLDSCMMGLLVAITKSTKENGATMVVPGSHLWNLDRAPKNEEAVPVELDVGDALIFPGNLYHGGGANQTKDQLREVIGLFMCKGYLRPEENHTLAVPPEKAISLSPQVQRLLGYGISQPAVGFYKYKDPMQVLFGVEDEETVHL